MEALSLSASGGAAAAAAASEARTGDGAGGGQEAPVDSLLASSADLGGLGKPNAHQVSGAAKRLLFVFFFVAGTRFQEKTKKENAEVLLSKRSLFPGTQTL